MCSLGYASLLRQGGNAAQRMQMLCLFTFQLLQNYNIILGGKLDMDKVRIYCYRVSCKMGSYYLDINLMTTNVPDIN